MSENSQLGLTRCDFNGLHSGVVLRLLNDSGVYEMRFLEKNLELALPGAGTGTIVRGTTAKKVPSCNRRIAS